MSEKEAIRLVISLCSGRSGTANIVIPCAVIGRVTKGTSGKLLTGLLVLLIYISGTPSVRRRASTLSPRMTDTLWRIWFPITRSTTARTAKTIRTATTTISRGTAGPKVRRKILSRSPRRVSVADDNEVFELDPTVIDYK